MPAPPLTPALYQSLSPRRRALHDLHRTATHVNMRLKETPMSARVANLMRGRLQNNAVNWLRTTDYQPYYGALKPLLEDHARLLAEAIDNRSHRR